MPLLYEEEDILANFLVTLGMTGAAAALAIAVGVRGPILSRKYELVAGARWQGLSRLRKLDIRIFGNDTGAGTPERYPRYLGLRDVVTIEGGLERASGHTWR